MAVSSVFGVSSIFGVSSSVSSIFGKEKGRTSRPGLTRVVTRAALGLLSSRALSSAQVTAPYQGAPTTSRGMGDSGS